MANLLVNGRIPYAIYKNGTKASAVYRNNLQLWKNSVTLQKGTTSTMAYKVWGAFGIDWGNGSILFGGYNADGDDPSIASIKKVTYYDYHLVASDLPQLPVDIGDIGGDHHNGGILLTGGWSDSQYKIGGREPAFVKNTYFYDHNLVLSVLSPTIRKGSHPIVTKHEKGCVTICSNVGSPVTDTRDCGYDHNNVRFTFNGHYPQTTDEISGDTINNEVIVTTRFGIYKLNKNLVYSTLRTDSVEGSCTCAVDKGVIISAGTDTNKTYLCDKNFVFTTLSDLSEIKWVTTSINFMGGCVIAGGLSKWQGYPSNKLHFYDQNNVYSNFPIYADNKDRPAIVRNNMEIISFGGNTNPKSLGNAGATNEIQIINPI